MSFELSSTLKPSLQSITLSDDAVKICPPFYLEETTTRTEILNAEGKTQGFDDLVSGFGYTYTTHYDVELNYLGTEYKSVEGSYWTTTRLAITNADSKITGFTDETKGGNGDYNYTSTANYDANMASISSSYSDSIGQVSTSSQTTELNSDGSIAFYDYEASSISGTSSSKSSTRYDANWNLIDSSYSDGNGYSSSTHRTTQLDSNGNILGYTLVGSGGSAGAPQFLSSEKYDANYTLLSSTYSDGVGYQSTYLYEVLKDNSGVITGYRYTSTWTYGADTQKSIQEYDANWHLVSSDVPSGTDNGPTVLPICYQAPTNIVFDAKTSDSTISSSAIAHTKVTEKPQSFSGKDGDDVYVVTDKHDKVMDSGKSGIDSLASSDINLNLASANYRGLENCDLLGAKNLSALGNSKDNQLSGNTGANIIDGMYGNDTLFGGAGKDLFRFDTRLDAKHNTDSIVDFESGIDQISLSRKVFSKYKVATTNLTSDFVSGPSAKAIDSTDHFIYDTATGMLSYDPDGSGSKVPVVFVTLTGAPALAASDLVIV